MTTVACDARGTLCADGQSQTTWGVITSTKVKKIVVEKNAVYALAGAAALLAPLIQWHKDGCNPTALPICTMEGGWSLFVWLRASGPELYTSAAPYKDIIELPFAMGIGAELAIGAMEHGASAKQAVEIAMRRHNSSGGEIRVVDIHEAFLRKTVLVKNEKTGRNVVRLEPTG